MKKDDKQFVYTVVGAAFGLGGVLRFPALCLSYGGAFVLAYAAVLAALGFPLLAAELALGKKFRCAFPLGRICPAGGVVGAASAVNSALMCSCYGVIISLLAVRACTFHASINYGYFQDMQGLLPFFACLAFIALAFFLSKSARVRSRTARCAVIFQAAMFFVLAVRGLCFSNAGDVLLSAFRVEGALFLSGGMWLSAFGQALLSLSVAAGVMPAFAVDMPRRLSPFIASAIICTANFFGGLLAAVATLTLAGGSGVLGEVGGSALYNALALYPAALRYSFSDGNICGFFGCLFYLSLTATAFVSALSLARPAYVWVKGAPVSSRTAAFVLSAALFAICLPFACGLSFAPVDTFCCNIAAPLCALGEILCIAFPFLTARREGGIIKSWKNLNS